MKVHECADFSSLTGYDAMKILSVMNCGFRFREKTLAYTLIILRSWKMLVLKIIFFFSGASLDKIVDGKKYKVPDYEMEIFP